MANSKNNSGMKSVIAALTANIVVAIVKFIGYGLSGSVSMLNESIHSLVDCGNQILLIVGDKKSQKLATDIHPFGEVKAKYFFSMLVATLLFFIGGIIGTMEAIDKMFHPGHEITNPTLILSILIIGIIIEIFSLRIAFKEVAELNIKKMPIFKFLKETRHSEILVIVAEDTCAIIGLIIAFIGTILTVITQNSFYDALAGVLIGLLLMAAALFLLKEFYSLIIGESVSDDDLKIITETFDYEFVEHLIDLKAIHMGADEIIIVSKISLLEKHKKDVHKIINDIETNIRIKMKNKKCYIYIEVDEYDESRV